MPRRRREHSEQVVFPSGIFFDDAVGVLFDNLVFNPQLLQIRRQNMLREPWLLLIEVHRHQREGDGRAFLQIAQDLQHGIAVLAA